jgi:outer membrane protein assembly complex protein YaeT
MKLRYIRIAALSLGGVMLAGIAILHTPPTKRYALNELRRALAAEGIALEAESLDYNVIAGRASLRQVTLTPRPGMPPLLRLAGLDASASVFDLLRGRLVVRNIALTKPEIYLLIDANGVSNLPQWPAATESTGSTTSILVDAAFVSGASLRVEDRQSQTSLFIPDWQMTVDGNPVTGRHQIDLQTLRPASLTREAKTYPIDRLQATLDLGDNDLRVNGLNLESLGATLRASGAVQDFATPVLDLQAEANAPLAPFADGQPVSGQARLQVQARGTLNKLQVTGRLQGQNLQYADYRDIRLETDLGFDQPTQMARLRKLRLRSPLGQATADLDLALQKGASRLNAQLEGLRLDAASRLARSPYVIASRASGSAVVQWPGLDWQRATSAADLQLQPIAPAASNVIPVSGSLSARTNGGAGSVTLSGVSALGATVHGAAQIDRQQRLSGQLTVAAGDLTQSASLAQRIFATDAPAVTGQARAAVTLAGTLPRPEAQVHLNASPLTVNQLPIDSVELNAAYRPDLLTLQNSSVRWKGQEMTTSGTVGLGNGGALQLTTATSKAEIADLLAALGQSALPISGQVQANAEISGTTSLPQAQLRATAANLSAYQQPFGRMDLAASLSPQRVAAVKLAWVKSPAEQMELDATYQLEIKDLRAKLTSTPFELTTFTMPGVGPVVGAFTLNATANGTGDDPRAEATLAVSNLHAGRHRVGDLTSQFAFANNTVNATVAAPGKNVTAQAQVKATAPYAFTAEAHARQTNLASLPLSTDVPATGTFSFDLTAAGQVNNPKSIQATLRSNELNLQVKGQPVTLQGPFHADYADEKLTVHGAALQAPGTTLALAGTLPGALNVDLQSNLADLAKFAPETPLKATGQLTAAGQISGTLQDPQPNITLRIADASVTAPDLPPLTEANLQATLAGKTVMLDSLTAQLMNGTLTGSGSTAGMQIAVQNLDLSRTPGAPDGLQGRFSATLNAKAPQLELDAVEATLRIDELKTDYERVHLEQEGPSTFRLAKGLATVEKFAIKGPNTAIALTGTAQLTGTPQVNLELAGRSDIGIASLLVEDLRAQGLSTVQLAVRGPLSDPAITGSLDLTNGEIALNSPRIAAEKLNLHADLSGHELRLTRLQGDLNGGTLSGGGTITWNDGVLGGPGLTVATRNVYLDFPANLRTVSNLDLKLAPGARQRTLLSGSVQIAEGSYTDTLTLEDGLFNLASRSPELELTDERNPFLSKLDYNIAVRTKEPLVINNNLAKLEIDVDTRVLGNYYSPGLTGRVNLAEGGELYLSERKYLVDRGVITFISDQRIEPVFDLQAKTEAAGYEVTLAVTGSGKDRETVLTSDPPLPEPDIASVLLTGRTIDRLQGQETDVAKEQVLSYLTGRVGGSLGRGIQEATGISQVKIEPGLIANESDPSARLTVGQNLTRQLSLIYSMNLINSGDQILIGQYDFSRRFRGRTLKQSDNSYRFDFNRTQEFGGEAPPPRTAAERERRTLGRVEINHGNLFSEKQIRKWLNAREGKPYDFFQLRKGVDRVESRYARAGLLESRVRLQRDPQGSAVNVQVDIDPGPQVDFVFEGYSPSRALRKRIRETWMAGLFDVQRAGDAAAEIRQELLNDRYVEAKVDYLVDVTDAEHKRVTFDIQPGLRFEKYKIVFAGASQVDEADLRQLLRDQKAENEAVTKPRHIIDLVARFYHELGYLDAKLARPELIVDREARTAQSVFPVAEGALYRVSRVDYTGHQVYTDAELAAVTNLEAGLPYTPQLRQDTVDNIRALYGRKGYNDAEVAYALEREPQAPGQLRVALRINEGKQSVLGNVEVSSGRGGNFVRKQLVLQPGDPMDLQLLSQSRRQLYSTGAYSLIDTDRTVRDSSSNQQPVDLRITAREVRPFLLNYGAYFDTDRGPGGIADITNRNSLGLGRVAGVRLRYDRDLQESRFYFSQPFLRSWPLRTTAASFIRREIREGFNTDRIGLSILQEARFRGVWSVNYGYRIENTHTYENVPDPLFNVYLRVAPFTTSLSRDTRDDILDATRGSFTSHGLDYAPTWSGSELNFIKYFGQYFRYIALDKPRLLPMQRNVRRSRLIVATGVRVGLATGLGGQGLIPGRSSTGQVALGERFFAGGGTTVRGFAQDGIGPRLSDGISPAGGDAMFVWNSELRFPLFKIFDGVGFTDLGNVYDGIGDFRPWQLRKAAGFGLRIRTPFFLIRFDYGFKLDRKPGESLGRPFISIGQAF